MGAWAIHETRMRVERRAAADGRDGWTVTWKGRGWDRSFDDYLALVRAAGDLTRAGELLAVPSVKYHLPRLDEPFRDGGVPAHDRAARGGVGRGRRCRSRRTSRPRSPGTRWPTSAARILRWLREVPGADPQAAGSGADPARAQAHERAVRRRLSARDATAAAGADALVCFNRLWDAGAERGLRRLGPERAQPPRARARRAARPTLAAAHRDRQRLLRPHGPGLRPRRLRERRSCTPSSSFRSREYPAAEGSRTSARAARPGLPSGRRAWWRGCWSWSERACCTGGAGSSGSSICARSPP